MAGCKQAAVGTLLEHGLSLAVGLAATSLHGCLLAAAPQIRDISRASDCVACWPGYTLFAVNFWHTGYCVNNTVLHHKESPWTSSWKGFPSRPDLPKSDLTYDTCTGDYLDAVSRRQAGEDIDNGGEHSYSGLAFHQSVWEFDSFPPPSFNLSDAPKVCGCTPCSLCTTN